MEEFITSYPSWIEFVDAAEFGDTDMVESERSSRNTSNDGWSGTRSFQQAVELARGGWKDGMSRINQTIETLHPIGHNAKLEIAMARMGPGTLDMGRHAMGHPEPWMVFQETEEYNHGTGKIVTILYSMSASAYVTAGELFRKGAAVCSLINNLEANGRRCEIVLTGGALGGFHSAFKIGFTVMVKRPDEPLDIDRIAFSIAHASSFRRLGFSIFELAPMELREKIGVKKYGGYGMPSSVRLPADIFVPESSGYDSDFRDAKSIDAWVQKHLEAQGVKLL